MGTNSAKRLNWRLPLVGGVGAVIVTLPLMIWHNGLLAFFAAMVTGAIVTVILLVVFIRTVRAQSAAALVMIAVFGAGCWLLFKASGDIFTFGRWLLLGWHYRAEVLAQPDSASGELKHVDWDGWGIVGVDTQVYLVYDPSDNLHAAAQSGAPGTYRGIPCKEVYNVRRLERHWYIVQFYTDEYWNDCTYETAPLVRRRRVSSNPQRSR